MKKLTILFGAAAIALGACGSKKDGAKKDDKSGSAQASGDPSAKPAEPSAPAAPAAPAKEKTCADYGGTGKGTFEDMCKLKGPAPFTIVASDDYKDDFGAQRRVIKVTNKMDHAVDWGTFYTYYYDKDGKPMVMKADDGHDIGTSSQASGGGMLTVGAGETAELALGSKKEVEPAGGKLEMEIVAWGWQGTGSDNKGGMFFTAHADQPDLDMEKRPMGGYPAAAK